MQFVKVALEALIFISKAADMLSASRSNLTPIIFLSNDNYARNAYRWRAWLKR